MDLNKWTPEYFTRRVYSVLTRIRVITFLILVVIYFTSFVIIVFLKSGINTPDWLNNWGIDDFTLVSSQLVKFLFGVLGLGGILFPITIGIVQTKISAQEVTSLWTNLVKYVLVYPFSVIVFIQIILFVVSQGVNIPALFILFLIIVFLTLNAFYATIRMGEILINQAFSKRAKAEGFKRKYSPKFLKKSDTDQGTFRLFRFEKQHGRIYMYDLNTQTRHWIKNMQTVAELGYESNSWTDVTEENIPETYKTYTDGEDIDFENLSK